MAHEPNHFRFLCESLATESYSRIRYYYFPQGDIDGCLSEHEKALAYAREIGSPEAEARALGGLGDANYMRGRIVTAYGYFDRCITLARDHGITRIEVSNLYMRGNMLQFRNRLQAALEDCRVAAELARRVGDQRAEIVALGGGSGWVFYDMGRVDEAIADTEASLALAKDMGAGRFESMMLVFLAKLQALEGRGEEALRCAERAVRIARDTSITFSGAMALSALALVTDDADRRREALVEGEHILRQRCVSHNYFYFYRDAIEVSLESRDWDEAERYATALETYTAEEPLPWTDLFIARGRALAAHGRGQRDDVLRHELERLRDEIVETGHLLALPAVEAVLAV